MPFDQSTITDGPDSGFDGSDYYVRWSSSSPEGTIFQVYIDGALTFSGTARSIFLDYIEPGAVIQIGTVDDAEAVYDQSADLDDVPERKKSIRLNWYGGRYLAEDIAGYRVYLSPVAGAPVGAEPVATIPATENGRWEDGAGRGRAGRGTAGRSEIAYSWTSGKLGNGTWSYEVRTFDAVGNEGAAESGSVNVVAAPEPPAFGPDGKRLRYAYNSTTRVATLSWLASPG